MHLYPWLVSFCSICFQIPVCGPVTRWQALQHNENGKQWTIMGNQFVTLVKDKIIYTPDTHKWVCLHQKASVKHLRGQLETNCKQQILQSRDYFRFTHQKENRNEATGIMHAKDHMFKIKNKSLMQQQSFFRKSYEMLLLKIWQSMTPHSHLIKFWMSSAEP